MAVSLSDLVAAPTVDAARALLLQYLTEAGFPATSWQVGSFPRRFVEAMSRAYVDVLTLVNAITKGGFLDYATGDWLTLLASNVYSIDRWGAVFAQGDATLADVGGIGPVDVAPNQLWARSLSGKRFRNITSGSLPFGGTLTLSWEAESPGIAYNAPAGTLTQLVTSLPGVGISNAGDPTTGEWLTQIGTDAEADDPLRVRCKARWPGLGGGATDLVYEAWARAASPQVTKVKVRGNDPADGKVTIVIAGATGALPARTVAIVQSYIRLRQPLCVLASVLSAVNREIPLTATLYAKAAFAQAVRAGGLDNLTAYQAALDIGGEVFTAALIEQLMLAPGMVDVVLGAPLTDVATNKNDIALLVPTLNVVSV